MTEYNLLKRIDSPEKLKKLSTKELNVLCQEIRDSLIETVSQTGGHLASNLGVVELTVALHKMFNSPQDQIVWDVGHQTYTHKILTGRWENFSTLRKENGLSGFSRPSESPHDIFYSGHSSTSISSAYGLSKAKELNSDNNYVIAVIGDGALTGGLAYEALNNAGREKRSNLIVILNDNKMSISKNVGSLSRHLAVVRSTPAYFKMKARIELFLDKVPLVGKPISKFIFRTKTMIKNMIYKSTVFEDMGFAYLGPIDGHDIGLLTKAIEGAKNSKRPALLHINTVKGKGYSFAEENPKHFHGVSQFDVLTGDSEPSSGSYSGVFGSYLCELAERDQSICAITAAMTLGTGLTDFSKRYKNRFFDVGIAEEHAVTFASGLARNGMKPVFSVYSTFLQRGYDQLIHDVALQKQKVIFAIDRAGFVGDDGETHQGVFDVPYINSIPGVTMLAPSSYSELKKYLYKAFYTIRGPVAIRFPRGSESSNAREYNNIGDNVYDLFGDLDAEIGIVTYGRTFSFAYDALKALESKVPIKLLKINQIKPLTMETVKSMTDCKNIIFFEEGLRSGGVGERFASMLFECQYREEYKIVSIEDEFIKQASVSSQLKKYKLDKDGIIDSVMALRLKAYAKEYFSM